MTDEELAEIKEQCADWGRSFFFVGSKTRVPNYVVPQAIAAVTALATALEAERVKVATIRQTAQRACLGSDIRTAASRIRAAYSMGFKDMTFDPGVGELFCVLLEIIAATDEPEETAHATTTTDPAPA